MITKIGKKGGSGAGAFKKQKGYRYFKFSYTTNAFNGSSQPIARSNSLSGTRIFSLKTSGLIVGSFSLEIIAFLRNSTPLTYECSSSTLPSAGMAIAGVNDKKCPVFYPLSDGANFPVLLNVFGKFSSAALSGSSFGVQGGQGNLGQEPRNNHKVSGFFEIREEDLVLVREESASGFSDFQIREL